MLNYWSFVKESTSRSETVYWDWEKLMDKNWSSIAIEGQNIYIVLEDKDQRQVILDVLGDKEMLKLPTDAIEKFWAKFAIEFKKKASEYLDNMTYVPKCCGKVEHLRMAKRFDM